MTPRLGLNSRNNTHSISPFHKWGGSIGPWRGSSNTPNQRSTKNITMVDNAYNDIKARLLNWIEEA
jgi:hypothetical protein